jgi:hypothetical protein
MEEPYNGRKRGLIPVKEPYNGRERGLNSVAESDSPKQPLIKKL